ncbi:MAG: trypsin-like peptidase domain-containing protein [Desulfobacterales bacterium]|nr:MAG: trypsin-like peptidase domain-containing protein [Desulfobacterales bacterium]
MKHQRHHFNRIVYLFILLLSPVMTQKLHAAELISKQVSNSVVKISVISQTPDYSMPWNPGRIEQTTGTGFLISGNRIMTNAHVSSNARFIVVEKEGDSRKYEANVKFIAHDCDLAILEVVDESFLDGLAPMSFGGIPDLNSTVMVIGYPIGGNRLSVTRGVVSRIDYQVYSHSSADSHLAIQIDAAINPGNSGGPVLQNNVVVGVAFQAYRGNVAQGVGYMIPVPVIHRFLTDINDMNYDKYVDLGVYLFPLINRAYRRALGLKPGDYGVMVSHVLAAGASAGILKAGDVLLAIENLPIYSNGHVEIDGRRVMMAEVVERKFKGDSVQLKIFRDKKYMDVSITLNSPWPYMMLAHRHDVQPRFVLFGGLIFQPLSYGYIRASQVKDVNILYHYSRFLDDEIYLRKPEVIVLSKILPDPINAYISHSNNSIVHKINDRVVRTLEDVSALFKESKDYYKIQLLGKGRPIVIERKAAMDARDRILNRYRVLKDEYLGDAIVPDEWISSSNQKN